MKQQLISLDLAAETHAMLAPRLRAAVFNIVHDASHPLTVNEITEHLAGDIESVLIFVDALVCDGDIRMTTNRQGAAEYYCL